MVKQRPAELAKGPWGEAALGKLMEGGITFNQIERMVAPDPNHRATFASAARVLAALSQGGAGLEPADVATIASQLAALREPPSHAPLDRYRRLNQAYALLAYSAFFAALAKTLERVYSLLGCDARTFTSRRHGPRHSDLQEHLLTLPDPVVERHLRDAAVSALHDKLANATAEYVRAAPAFETATEAARENVEDELRRLPNQAHNEMHAQGVALAARHQEFLVWSHFQHFRDVEAATAEETRRLNELSESLRAATKRIDMGFRDFRQAIGLLMPKAAPGADDVHAALRRKYKAEVAKPVLNLQETGGLPQALRVPDRGSAFIPQHYRSMRFSGTEAVEAEETWRKLDMRTDLGPHILQLLETEQAETAPLLVLGHPGSGKSLLTLRLAADLSEGPFVALRLVLKDTDPTHDILSQLEAQIRRDTGHHISWPDFVDSSEGKRIVLLVDGYDELLQITGEEHTNFIMTLARLQESERDVRKPLRVILTSRITLISKAAMPVGTAIIRLQPFGPAQIGAWVDMWNTVNAQYFSGPIQPLEIPMPTSNRLGRQERRVEDIYELAQQPLLLLMLALYDAEKNDLRKMADLDRTQLYDNLLQRFLQRQAGKTPGLSTALRETQVALNAVKLGMAAAGMFARGRLYIRSEELYKDLAALAITDPDDAATESDVLVGSFFFLHRSEARRSSSADPNSQLARAYEFLHSSFGEFLLARLIARDWVTYVSSSDAQEGRAGPNITKALLAAAPLHERPYIVTLFKEWLPHELARAGLSREAFIEAFDRVAAEHLEAAARGDERILSASSPYPQPRSSRALSTYSLNLAVLRGELAPPALVLGAARQDDATFAPVTSRALAGLWRSCFVPEALAKAVRHFAVSREGPRSFLGQGGTEPRSSTHASQAFAVASALAEDTEAQLAGFHLQESQSPEDTQLVQVLAPSTPGPLRSAWLLRRLVALRNRGSAHYVEELKLAAVEAATYFQTDADVEILRLARAASVPLADVAPSALQQIRNRLAHNALVLNHAQLLEMLHLYAQAPAHGIDLSRAWDYRRSAPTPDVCAELLDFCWNHPQHASDVEPLLLDQLLREDKSLISVQVAARAVPLALRSNQSSWVSTYFAELARRAGVASGHAPTEAAAGLNLLLRSHFSRNPWWKDIERLLRMLDHLRSLNFDLVAAEAMVAAHVPPEVLEPGAPVSLAMAEQDREVLRRWQERTRP